MTREIAYNIRWNVYLEHSILKQNVKYNVKNNLKKFQIKKLN